MNQQKRFQNATIALLFIILFAIALLVEETFKNKYLCKDEKVEVINQIKENYKRICDDFGMDYHEIIDEHSTIIGCIFVNEKNQTKLWSSYVDIKNGS